MNLDFREQYALNKIAWHSLPVDVIAALYVTDIKSGLSDEDVEIRRAILRTNITPSTSKPLRLSGIHKIIHSLSAAAVSIATLSRQLMGHSRKPLIRTLHIIRESPNRKTENIGILRSLPQRRASVMRNGLLIRLSATELVLGDVIFVEAGDFVPADGRLFLSQSLSSLELPLNGNATPVKKSTSSVVADAPLSIRSDMIYMGTQIATGSGRAIVVATGIHTEISRKEIAKNQFPKGETI